MWSRYWLLARAGDVDAALSDWGTVLDLERDARPHWAFGHGIHHCLGNAVARLEVRVALQVLLEAIPDWEIDEPGVVLEQLVPTRGVAHAPIRFRAS